MACSRQPTQIPDFVTAEEYDVYRDILLKNPEMWNIPQDAEIVVFFDQTFMRTEPEDVRTLLQVTEGV